MSPHNKLTVAINRYIGPSEILQVKPTVNKSCIIECCGNKIHKIVGNMTFSQYIGSPACIEL